MKISSEYVGRTCLRLETTVTPRRAMNYAAAVGDGNPWHLDDTRPEGIVAPPMLAVALTWPISERFSEFWGETGFPTELLARQVHYSESLTWTRPIQAEERLFIDGRVLAMLPHRGGTHLILEYTATDTSGETVFVERIGGLLRGVGCLDAGRGGGGLKFDNDYAGDGPPLWRETLRIDPLAAHWYDAGADIHFPIHTSPAFARFVGLPGAIYHGTATLSLALRELVRREAGNDPRRVRSLSCLFTAMVTPGSEITVELLGKEKEESGTSLAFTVKNQAGKTALRAGSLLIADD